MSAFNVGGVSLDTSWFLLLAAILFILGTIGVLVRRNPLVILICIELMLNAANLTLCLLYTSPSPRDLSTSRMPSSA